MKHHLQKLHSLLAHTFRHLGPSCNFPWLFTAFLDLWIVRPARLSDDVGVAVSIFYIDLTDRPSWAWSKKQLIAEGQHCTFGLLNICVEIMHYIMHFILTTHLCCLDYSLAKYIARSTSQLSAGFFFAVPARLCFDHCSYNFPRPSCEVADSA